MIIENGMFENAMFTWGISSLNDDMVCNIKFLTRADELEKLDDSVFMDAFGLECKRGQEPFYWNRHKEKEHANEYVYIIEWIFDFKKLLLEPQKYQFMNAAFNGIHKINEALKSLNIEDNINLNERSVDLFVYAESLFDTLVTNDWYEGNAEEADNDMKTQIDRIRKILSVIRKYDDNFPVSWFTASESVRDEYPDGLTEATLEKAFDNRYWQKIER